ncbi:MAG: NUDIX hydrolase [Candidatus Komeilibacteria bacterium]
MKREVASYQVGPKLLLRKGSKYLFLYMPRHPWFDWPGGRIDIGEEHVPFEAILRREVTEELGSKLKYRISKPTLIMRRWLKTGEAIVHIYYEAEYISGDIKLSDEHRDLIWINPRTYRFKPGEFISREEYKSIKQYFNNK